MTSTVRSLTHIAARRCLTESLCCQASIWTFSELCLLSNTEPDWLQTLALSLCRVSVQRVLFIGAVLSEERPQYQLYHKSVVLLCLASSPATSHEHFFKDAACETVAIYVHDGGRGPRIPLHKAMMSGYGCLVHLDFRAQTYAVIIPQPFGQSPE